MILKSNGSRGKLFNKEGETVMRNVEEGCLQAAQALREIQGYWWRKGKMFQLRS